MARIKNVKRPSSLSIFVTLSGVCIPSDLALEPAYNFVNGFHINCDITLTSIKGTSVSEMYKVNGSCA